MPTSVSSCATVTRDWLRSLLTTDKVRELLEGEYHGGKIERFEMENIRAVHFLLVDHLDRGLNACSTYNTLGKNVCEYLRCKHVDIPTKFLRGESYKSPSCGEEYFDAKCDRNLDALRRAQPLMTGSSGKNLS